MKVQNRPKNRFGRLWYLIAGFILALQFTTTANAQHPNFKQIKDSLDHYYGYEVLIHNGIPHKDIYVFSIGHPYLKSENFELGTIYIRGRAFSQCSLNYNIVDQQIIYEYTDINKVNARLIINPDRIDSFFFDGKVFIPLKIKGKQYYANHLNSGTIKWVQVFTKILGKEFRDTDSRYKISDLKLHNYIYQNGETRPFKSKRSFLKCFDKPLQKPLKASLKQHKIKIRKCTPTQVSLLMKKCNSYVEKD